MGRNHLTRKGGDKGGYAPSGVGQKEADCNHLGPDATTCNHLENGQIAQSDQSCNHRNHLSISKGLEKGGKKEKGAYGVNNRPEVVTVVTVVTGFVHLTVEGTVSAARKDQRAKLVACSDTGERVGEYHHKARLTDAQVDQIRDRFEAHPVGHPQHEGYRVLAKAYGVSKRTIRDIVDYRRRNAFPAKWKRVTTY